MEAMQVKDTLSRVPLFAGLGAEQLRAVGEVIRMRSWQSGEVILREGEPGQAAYILLSGTVQVSKKLSLGSSGEEMEKSLVHLDSHEPTVFGEVGLVNKSIRSATVTAVQMCEAFEIDAGDFTRLCEADPLLGYTAMRNLSQILETRLRKANQDVIKLATALSLALSH